MSVVEWGYVIIGRLISQFVPDHKVNAPTNRVYFRSSSKRWLDLQKCAL